MYPVLVGALSIVSLFTLSHTQPTTPTATPHENRIAIQKMSLNNRYGDSYVNDVYKDNILLTLGYQSGTVKTAQAINFDNLRKPFTYSFTLNTGEVYAFHEDVLPHYKKDVVLTTQAHYDFDQGFRHSGRLIGDGVCHLASLMKWAAADAGLEVVAPTNHDFALIPEIPREHGVSIFYMPGNTDISTLQNLYIKNNRSYPVRFEFEYKKDEVLSLSVYEVGKGII